MATLNLRGPRITTKSNLIEKITLLDHTTKESLHILRQVRKFNKKVRKFDKKFLNSPKSPKIASWPGILVSHKETRTKVVLEIRETKSLQAILPVPKARVQIIEIEI